LHLLKNLIIEEGAPTIVSCGVRCLYHLHRQPTNHSRAPSANLLNPKLFFSFSGAILSQTLEVHRRQRRKIFFIKNVEAFSENVDQHFHGSNEEEKYWI
jgi:hypothetical protein